MHIRKLESHELNLHRGLRLRALRDSPDSFGETFADVVARPTSYWEDLTRSVTEPERHVMFLACEGEHVLGSTYGLLDREQSEAGRVGGMWVDPAWRRRGIGRALLQEVFGWARARGLSCLGADGNADLGAGRLSRDRKLSTAPNQSLVPDRRDGL